MSIRIVLVDDHKIIRDGLRALIERTPGMDVVAESDNGRTAVQLVRKIAPQVVIMDIGMPELNGIEATRQIVSNDGNIKVIALSMHSDRAFVVGMLRAGASGYLLKDCAFEEMAHAVQTVVDNHVYLSPEITDVVLSDYLKEGGTREADRESSDLTPREREVLQLLAEGKSIQDTATALNITVKTVEAARQRIRKKLDLHSIADLTRYALRMGLTSLES